MTQLVDHTLRDFTTALASDAPAPGGGSASAAAGATGAALLAMVVRLTLGKEKYKSVWAELEPYAPRLEECRKRLLELVDEDTNAYHAIVDARKMPKESGEEKAARGKAIDTATILATTVPMQTAFFAQKALAMAPAIAEKGNPNASSDAYVGALLLFSAVEGALANVRINLPGVTDPVLKRSFREDSLDLEKKSLEAVQKARDVARARTLGG